MKTQEKNKGQDLSVCCGALSEPSIINKGFLVCSKCRKFFIGRFNSEEKK